MFDDCFHFSVMKCVCTPIMPSVFARIIQKSENLVSGPLILGTEERKLATLHETERIYHPNRQRGFCTTSNSDLAFPKMKSIDPWMKQSLK